jgi:hypothetical protein
MLDGGPTVLIPDMATRLLHNVLHAQVADRQRRKRILNLRQLLEFAALAHQASPDLKGTDLRPRLHPERHDVLAEYWVQAERWLGLPYPEALPRSPHQRRELWLIERVATQSRWHRWLTLYDLLCRLPRRVVNLLIRLIVMPVYFPAKFRALIQSMT